MDVRNPVGAAPVPGLIMILLTAVYALYLTGVALYRQRATVERGVGMKIYRYEMVICACLMALALDWRFGLQNLLPVAVAVILRLVALAIALPSVAVAVMILARLRDVPRDGADTAIVLGMALEHGRPPADLVARVQAARDYALAHPGMTLILTGGNAPDGGASEAEIMRALLLDMGVDSARVVVEDRAVDTFDNFENVARLVDPARPVVLVTSGYHLLRAGRVARRAGFRHVRGLAARCSPALLPANLMWEIVCMADYLVKALRGA